MLDDGRQVAQLVDLPAQHAVDHGQKVGGVGERDRGVRALFGDRLLQHRLCFGDEGIGATDRTGSNVFGHVTSPCGLTEMRT